MFKWLREKLNPAQEYIQEDTVASTNTNITNIIYAYEKIDVVNRGTNLIVDSCASISIDVADKLKTVTPISSNVPRPAKINTLLNYRPNPYINADVFKRNIFMDLLMDGNAFIYWDGAFLYNIPAAEMEIVSDKITFIKEYRYLNVTYSPNQIIHIRDNSARSIYRGDSRLRSALTSINVLQSMTSYQTNFFDNNAIPGLVLSSPDMLSQKIKDRKILEWTQQYNPKRGGRKPMIVDGGFKLETLGDSTYKELDFSKSMETHQNKVLEALGVPPVLFSSGNNANINPNLRLFYINTIIPLFTKYLTGLELFFGYDLKENRQDILALRPELKDEGNYLATLVNAGIITRNESRAKIRMPESTDEIADKLILPANIAGSAVDSSTGGKPTNEEI